jgi:hypothetical protein
MHSLDVASGMLWCLLEVCMEGLGITLVVELLLVQVHHMWQGWSGQGVELKGRSDALAIQQPADQGMREHHEPDGSDFLCTGWGVGLGAVDMQWN